MTKRAEWTGSIHAAPGPGVKQENGTWRLYGEVARISPADPKSIKVRWDNDRVTIERLGNLRLFDES